MKPRPVFFEVLLRIEFLLATYDMHPGEEMPDAQIDPQLYDWRHARVLCRKVQGDARDTTGPPEPLEMLESLRTLLFIVARGQDWPNVHDFTDHQILERFGHFQYQLGMCLLNERQNPPILWFPPLRRQQEVRQLAGLDEFSVDRRASAREPR